MDTLTECDSFRNPTPQTHDALSRSPKSACAHRLPPFSTKSPIVRQDKPSQAPQASHSSPHLHTSLPPPTMSTTPLFPPHLLSPSLSSSLPSTYTLRPLQKSDRANLLSVLSVLTTVGEISEEAWNERYDYLARHNDTYFILVVCDGEGRVVGTGGVVVERKL